MFSLPFSLSLYSLLDICCTHTCHFDAMSRLDPPSGADLPPYSQEGSMKPSRPERPNSPRKDFAMAAFQNPEKMDKLIRGLKAYDFDQAINQIGLRGGRVITVDPNNIQSLIHNGFSSLDEKKVERRKSDLSSSSTEKDEPKLTIVGKGGKRKPVGENIVNLDSTDEESKSAEIEEVEVELGISGVKRSAKKKKNKKKKGKSKVKEEVVIVEPEGDDVEEEEDGDKLSAITLPQPAAEIEIPGRTGVESVVIDSALEGKEENPLPSSTHTSPDLHDASNDTSFTSTAGVSIIITPDSPNISLPAVWDTLSIDKQQEELTFEISQPKEVKRNPPQIKVRLPRQLEKKENVQIKNEGKPEPIQEVADITEETKVATPENGTERSVDFSAQIGNPLTPPCSPTLSLPEPPNTIIDPVPLAYDEPLTPPQTLNEPGPELSPSEYPDAKPLSKAWTLYHSNSSQGGLKYGQVGIQGVLPVPPPGRTKAEEYSHGLFRLFTATNVVDLLGTWKALRRKIAYKKGRVIEPEGQRITLGMEGLGIPHLPKDTNFHFFIASVKPMWEDPMCTHGGKIMMTGPPGVVCSHLWGINSLELITDGLAVLPDCPSPRWKRPRSRMSLSSRGQERRTRGRALFKGTAYPNRDLARRFECPIASMGEEYRAIHQRVVSSGKDVSIQGLP